MDRIKSSHFDGSNIVMPSQCNMEPALYAYFDTKPKLNTLIVIQKMYVRVSE